MKNGFKKLICQKRNILYIGPYDFGSYFASYGPNIYQIMYGKTLVCSFSIGNCSKKEGGVVVANLLHKLFSDQAFYVPITDSGVGSVKSFHTSF